MTKAILIDMEDEIFLSTIKDSYATIETLIYDLVHYQRDNGIMNDDLTRLGENLRRNHKDILHLIEWRIDYKKR